ncbi:nucleotidyltransferase family protein [Pontibacter sp. G13]|uniref:nucleotidyltransferase family protein n=1 Tax=Pontibacter sp. G13 TaxID=3074898 RepID=UPI00288B1401|nr:nucleotidyltransferase family protein [Pontibacter sp. G13]WNJ19264.1 nucleotidyltransferase family protein [Pontibacter sp. G13]
MNSVLTYHDDLSLEDVIRTMEERTCGSLVLIDAEAHLVGLITDGDIRRGILDHKEEVKEFIQTQPICLSPDSHRPSVIREAQSKRQAFIPEVDHAGKLVKVIEIPSHHLPRHPNKVVIMAGGLGLRLGELTRRFPKPMLPLGHKPVLHIIVDSFVEQGFTDIYMCLHYKSEIIKEYFGDGSNFGAQITYFEEPQPLGTAGPLGMISEGLDEPFFVMNGDLVTTLNFENLLHFHLEKEAIATMCTHEYNQRLPYGVVNTRNSKILSLEEKPYHKYFVNAGIYVLNPQVLDLIPTGEYLDMTALFDGMIQQDLPVNAYIINEFWADIGQIRDYEAAQEVFTHYRTDHVATRIDYRS